MASPPRPSPDYSPLPQEDLPPSGEAGGTYGWPTGVMSASIVTTLRSEGITKTSHLFALVNSISEERFRIFMEGQEDQHGASRNLYRAVQGWLARPETRREHLLRVPGPRTREEEIAHPCRWTGADYNLMIGLLTTVRVPPTPVAEAYLTDFKRGYLVWRAIRGRALTRP
jgi:hypothetical protein